MNLTTDCEPQWQTQMDTDQVRAELVLGAPKKGNLPGRETGAPAGPGGFIRLDPTGSECSIFSNPIQASLSPGEDGWPMGGENEDKDEEDSSKRPSAYAKATARQDENAKIKPN